jgi:hypothetical protein
VGEEPHPAATRHRSRCTATPAPHRCAEPLRHPRKIWNGFEADKHLGDRGWNVTGIEKFPPLIARGVLIDVAGAKGVDMLPDSYRVTRQDLKDALARQKVNCSRATWC